METFLEDEVSTLVMPVSSACCYLESEESYAKISTFPAFYKEVWFLFTRKLPKGCCCFFPWLNSKIYFFHLVIFLRSKFYFGTFPEVMYSKSDFLF